MPIPNQQELSSALTAAGAAHHDYEVNTLAGVRDEQWAGWYAAYVLGRLDDFTTPTSLARWLTEAPSSKDWAQGAASYIIGQMDQ